MILVIESVIFCVLFTILVFLLSRNPIQTVYNYPPKIQERVSSLKEYEGKIPTKENKIFVKIGACIFFVLVISLFLRFVNGYTTFIEGFGYGFLLWTIVNLYDVIVLDILWFCHDPYFVLKGTEDMVDEYHNYWFHIKGFFLGEGIALVVCFLVGLVIQFIL